MGKIRFPSLNRALQGIFGGVKLPNIDQAMYQVFGGFEEIADPEAVKGATAMYAYIFRTLKPQLEERSKNE